MIKSSPWLRILAALIVGLAPLIVGLAWIKSQESTARATPTLEPIKALARSRRFDEAQELAAKFLQVFPNDAAGHLLMAQLATDRDDPQPSIALEHLGHIRESDPVKRALIEFLKGKAQYQAGRYDHAEDSWDEALRLDPKVPEAGSALLNLYELEGRLSDAYRLGLALHEVEPDPRDRVRLLLSVARLDLNKPSPESQTKLFGPLVAIVPENLKLSTSLGLALIRDSRPGPGVEILRKSLEQHSDSAEAWDALLGGLDEAGQPEELARQFLLLPQRWSDDVRFAKHRGQVAQFRHEWKAAAEAFRVAYENDRHDAVVLYRLSRALRLSGDTVEADRVAGLLNQYQTALSKLKAPLDQAIELKTLGLKPEPELFQTLADLREAMGRPDEARAWHRLILRDDPNQSVSLAAMERLK